MRTSRRVRLASAIAVAGLVGSVAVVGVSRASDHQDTPEVELNPRMDINDVYAFPGSAADRVVLAMTTSSPIQGSNAGFDPNLLYQFKIDNTGDGVEDLVLQATFTGAAGSQTLTLRGPVAPAMKGMKTQLVSGDATLAGAVGQTIGGGSGMQAFAGLRDDPFFIDLEQFFKILPDRRPSTGPLSPPSSGTNAPATATAFRPAGQAVDFLRTYNALAIVVELPKSMLISSTAADAKFGVWATISR
jgi:hypothetical protein